MVVMIKHAYECLSSIILNVTDDNKILYYYSHFMEEVPIEILLEIFYRCDDKSQVILKHVCKCWRSLVRNDNPLQCKNILNVASWWKDSNVKGKMFKCACEVGDIKMVKWMTGIGFKDISSGWGLASVHKHKEITTHLKSMKVKRNRYRYNKHLVRAGILKNLSGYEDEISYLPNYKFYKAKPTIRCAKGAFVRKDRTAIEYYLNNVSREHTVYAGLKFKEYREWMLREANEELLTLPLDEETFNYLIPFMDINRAIELCTNAKRWNALVILLEHVTEVPKWVLAKACQYNAYDCVETILRYCLADSSFTMVNSYSMVKLFVRYNVTDRADIAFNYLQRVNDRETIETLLQRGYLPNVKHKFIPQILHYVDEVDEKCIQEICETHNVYAVTIIKERNIKFSEYSSFEELFTDNSRRFYLKHFVEDLPSFKRSLKELSWYQAAEF